MERPCDMVAGSITSIRLSLPLCLLFSAALGSASCLHLWQGKKHIIINKKMWELTPEVLERESE